jgi:hypothetical protein
MCVRLTPCLTQTMAIREDSSKVIAAHELPAPRALVLRSLMPVLYAGMGVALGTLTGLSLTLISAPSGIQPVFHAATPASASVSVTTASQIAPLTTNESYSPAAEVRVAEVRTDQADVAASASAKLAASTTLTSFAEKAQRKPKAQIAPGKALPIEQNPVPERAPAVRRQPHSLIHPFARQARPVLASLQVSDSVDMSVQPVHQDETNNPSQFYTEGDLTVAGYDATEGTIETSDGRTFVIGASVSMANATSWDDYRSNVHYRCDEDGSCMLARAGVVAPNARAI